MIADTALQRCTMRHRKGKERKGKERKGKERKGKERKGKERKGKERKGMRHTFQTLVGPAYSFFHWGWPYLILDL